ncbi:MAG: hypothetical protein M3357_05950 [Actinomycetota bacterium]|nr:hypothetical protein [Actinomycetota bacterium]
MFRGLILDGVTGTGKSTLFRCLRSHPCFTDVDSAVFLSQSYTLRVAPGDRIEGLLDDVLGQLEMLHGHREASGFARREDGRADVSFLFEGFHHYAALEHVEPEDRLRFAGDFEARLGPLGAKLVALSVSPEAVLERCVRSTLRHRGSGWRQFLTRFGDTEEDVAAYYRERQRHFLALVKTSTLPVLHVDTSDVSRPGEWRAVAETIAGFHTRSEPWAA